MHMDHTLKQVILVRSNFRSKSKQIFCKPTIHSKSSIAACTHRFSWVKFHSDIFRRKIRQKLPMSWYWLQQWLNGIMAMKMVTWYGGCNNGYRVFAVMILTFSRLWKFKHFPEQNHQRNSTWDNVIWIQDNSDNFLMPTGIQKPWTW